MIDFGFGGGGSGLGDSIFGFVWDWLSGVWIGGDGSVAFGGAVEDCGESAGVLDLVSLCRLDRSFSVKGRCSAA